jgi:5-hydroxyisourate hydrolase-like protein (transthyretin family)
MLSTLFTYMKVFFKFILSLTLILNGYACILSAQPTKSSQPAALAERMINNPDFAKNAKGEDFCWHARYNMDEFVTNYKLTQDTAWLNAGIKYYEFLISQMDTDPDGYKGWIGPYAYDNRFWQDALVGDAILITGLLDFSILVLENSALKKKYGLAAYKYIDLAEKNFAQKWDKRGTWYDDGPFGAYVGFSKFLIPGKLDHWIEDSTVNRAGISHPFNKQLDAAQVFLRLFRTTGKKQYRERAEKIHFTLKNHFQYFDDHYCWNYFEPLTPGDIDLKNRETLHGVWVHPWRPGYQASEVDKIVEAYHYGIVFNAEDIQRIINTNLEVMWNKDPENPRFINSNGFGADGDTTGVSAFKAAYGHSSVTKNAGELWTGLLDFNQTIRDLYEVRFKNGQHLQEKIRYEKTIKLNLPSFKRKFADKAYSIPEFKPGNSRELYLATVLPHRLQKDTNAIIICKTYEPGYLQIDLYSMDGKKLQGLYTGKIKEGTFITTWDGRLKDKNERMKKGKYYVRWSIGDGYRQFPVEII